MPGIIAIAAVFVMVLAAAALGRRVFRLARFEFDSLHSEIVFSAALGLGIFSVLIFIAGITGGYNRFSAGAGLLLLFLLVPDATILARDIARKSRPPVFKPFQALMLAFMIIALGSVLVTALAPPISWDATVHHIKLPLIWLSDGHMHRVDDLHSNGPLYSVMLNIPLMAMANDIAPAILHFAWMIICGLALAAFSRKRMGTSAVYLAAAIFFLMPMSAALGSEALADFPVAAYAMLAFFAFVRWWECGRKQWLYIAGAMVGFALGVKYTGVYLLLLLAAGIAARLITSARRELVGHSVIALLLALAIGAPCYMRSAVITGNPVYPVLANVIPTKYVSAAKTGDAPAVSVPKQYPRDIVNLVLFPVNYTLSFAEGITRGPRAEGVIHSPGGLLLALVPLIIVFAPVPAWAVMAVLAAVAGMMLVAPINPLPRYAIPFFIPCAAVAGLVFERFFWWKSLKRTVAAVACIVLAAQLVPFIGRAATRIAVATGVESREEYLMKRDDIYPMARYVAKNIPTQKTLFVGLRVYHFLGLHADVTMAMPLHQDVVDFPLYTDPQQLLGRIRSLGFTYVVVNEDVLSKRARFAFNLIGELDGHGLRRVHREKKLVLYEVERNNS